MKKLNTMALVFFLIFISEFLFGSLIDINFTTTANQVVVTLTFNKSPKIVYFGKNESKTVHYFLIDEAVYSSAYLPVSSGSVEGVHVIPIDGKLNLFIYTLSPVNSSVDTSGTKIYIRFPISMSSKRISGSFIGLKTELFFKEFADFFGLKTVVYDSAKGKDLNMKFNNSTVEDAIRGILTTTGLSYAYSSEGTLYFGSSEEISKNFAAFWQIYDGQVDSEKLRAVLGTGAYAAYSKDKSKLFVYGGVREYRLLTEALIPTTKISWYYIPYTASDQEIDDYMKRLSQIYDIKYVILPSQKSVAVYGADVKQVEELVRSYKPVVKEEKVNYVPVQVNYPIRVANAFKMLYPEFEPKVVGSFVYVPAGYEKTIQTLSADPTIGNPWRLVFDDVPEDVVRRAISYFEIKDEDYSLQSSDGRVFITIFVNETIYKRFMQFVDLAGDARDIVRVDNEFLKKFNVTVLQTFSDGTKLVSGRIDEIQRLKKAIAENIVNLVIKITPEDPSAEVLTKITGYPTTISDGYLIVTVNKFEEDSVKKSIDNIRKLYGKEIVVVQDQYSPDAKKLVEEIYGVRTFGIDGQLVLYGPQASAAKGFLEKFSSQQQIVRVAQVESNAKSMVEELFNVKIYNVGDTSYVVGRESDVLKAQQYIQTLSSTVVEPIAKLTQTHIDYIKKVYNVNIEYFGDINKAYVVGSSDNVLRAAAYLKSLNYTTFVDSVKVQNNMKKEDIEKLARIIGLTIETEQIGDTVYLKGQESDIKRLKNEIQKLMITPALRYEVLAYADELDSVVKTLYKVDTYKVPQGYVIYGTDEQINSVKSFISNFADTQKRYALLNYADELDSLIKTLYGVQTMKTALGYFVIGSANQINDVRNFVSQFSEEKRALRSLYTQLESKDIETVISVFDPNVKYFRVGEKLYLVGKEESLEKITSEITQFKKDGEYNFVGDNLLVDVKTKKMSDLILEVSKLLSEQVLLKDDIQTSVSLRILIPSIDVLFERLKEYGIDYELKDGVYIISVAIHRQSVIPAGTQAGTPTAIQQEEVSVNNGLISINATNKNVGEIISQVLSKLGKSYKMENVQTMVYSIYLKDVDYETFKRVFSEFADIKEFGNIIYVSPVKKVIDEKVFVKDGRISVKVENEPIANVIRNVFESLGYSVVFSKPINVNATMSIADVDFESFTSIILNYGISIKRTGNIYVVDTTPEATKVRTTYTFNVTRGADKVKELIEFYGGKALVNTDAGLIIAYDLDPKNVDDINRVIDKVSKVKAVSIEAKVVDESLLSSLGFDMSLLLKSADYISIGTGGLSLKFKITDFMDIQELWNKILDNAEISFETSGAEIVTPKATSGRGKLLASPNIMAKSGDNARIFIGDSIPVKLTKRTEQGTTEEIMNLETGIELNIVPFVNPDNTIDINLKTAVGNFDYSVVIGGLPKSNKREVETKITLKDGQTLIIGGLAREEMSKSEWKIPILGDLPIIGWLFRGVKESTEQRNIVIFLTAKIVEQ
ncbi:type II secretion system protein GspD [Fervidobacterium gondwanense]|uniref:Type II and III secretion system protein n=1 Tax=Fervidobacterium gondwanense DSM 13020 TaxID=1121883 RepID=A0A1M7SS68_FERGO|nr:type II and III secretion system protein [Fervidobacterium gondwanense]SHN61220.1 type II and III secretion system protein [Fervidobacterium gondwanense DSM 13020]